jgi:hypothetical protein
MEKLKLTDLYTSEPVRLTYSSPTLLLFFSLKDILLLKELPKDLSNSLLKATGIYIGEESKKVHLWKQKEPESMESFNGGSSLKSFSELQVSELPWIVIISNNSLLLSKKLSEFEKPVIKSLLHRHPEFKKPKQKKQETLEEIIQSKKLTTDEKISLLENLSSESQGEIVGLRKELEEKDKVIRDIMHKL